MSKIKSAVELAMEKTGDIVIDKDVLRKDSLKKEGKILASRYLKKEMTDLKGTLKGAKPDDRPFLAEGITDIILANLRLPQKVGDLEFLPFLEQALLETGLEKRPVQEIFRQISIIFQQYLQSIEQMTGMLKKQYEPQLRAKEQKLMQQTGQVVKLEAERDPEFNRLLAERLGALDEQYRQVLTQAREEIKKAL
jgi:hypothetical protein